MTGTRRHRDHRRRRTAGLVGGVALAVVASGCQAGLPESVVKGSEVTVAWSSALTSANHASLADATPGNRDVAAMTRGRFAELVKGAVVPDEGFGSVEVTGDDPFTVRYDLAEPTWSDGIPVDSADLVLAWAAGSDGEGGFDAVPTGLAASERLASVEESDRAIEVEFSRPVQDWQTALDVAVPAHVLGQRALDIEDPMEAKKAVVDAVRDEDESTLEKLATEWNEGFRLSSDDIDEQLLVSSGPYRVTDIAEQDSGAVKVELVANGEYTGSLNPSFERVELVDMSDEEKVAALEAGDVDVAQVAPVVERRKQVRALERRDYGLATSHDGTMWVLALRADGPFERRAARAAFLRAVPRGDLAEAGGGAWADAYTSSNTVLFEPDGEGYDIAQEDSRFERAFGRPAKDPGAERARAGVPGGTNVCVLYERSSPFAQRAFKVLLRSVAEAGWSLSDCGTSELADPMADGSDWQAALVRVPVPRTAADLTRWWGGNGQTNLPGLENTQRDELIARWDGAADRYDARDLRARIERTIVDDAIALPVAMNPVVTLRVPGLDGVTPRPGATGSLTSGIAGWSRTDR